MINGTMGMLLAAAIVAGMLTWIAISDQKAAPLEDEFNVICLDGVEYWYRQVGYKGMMAPKFTVDGDVVACGGN